jgi:SAM-dependent methyltransferase
MSQNETDFTDVAELFGRAKWYDRTIDWPSRLAREIPVLADVFGPPGDGGILDAGCGTGRQACALAERGYRVTGADISEEVLDVARRNAKETSQPVPFVLTPYATLHDDAGGGYDGLYCIGNGLAAAETFEAASQAVAQFARCLRPGGRLVIQILNFHTMRDEAPCIRGPTVATVDGVEYVSVRHFQFSGDSVEVTRITLFKEMSWKCGTRIGTFCVISPTQLREWSNLAGLRIDETWGSYNREPFDVNRSTDLLVVATRV